MVNPEKIDNLLQTLQSVVNQLRAIARFEHDEFIKNDTIIGGAKYYLQTAIETCINIGTHIIASEGFRKPKDYREVFTILNEQDVFPDNFTIILRKMAGLRNRLVHLYWDVDEEQIYNYLCDNLGDFDTFAHYIVEFVKKKS